MGALLRPRRRILIGAGTFADAQTAIGLAERVADRMAADFLGVFVEETTIVEAVGLPGQKIVTASGALRSTPSRQQIQALIDNDAIAFQQRLQGVAQRRKVGFAFERLSGELVDRLFASAEKADVLIIGRQTHHRRTGCVALLGAPASQESSDLAAAIATALGCDIVALPAVGGAEDEQRSMARLDHMHASVVVIDRATGPFRTQKQLRRLLSAARCPILAVGASQPDSVA
jgi:K+-sensing histidine kinase KdpD